MVCVITEVGELKRNAKILKTVNVLRQMSHSLRDNTYLLVPWIAKRLKKKYSQFRGRGVESRGEQGGENKVRLFLML